VNGLGGMPRELGGKMSCMYLRWRLSSVDGSVELVGLGRGSVGRELHRRGATLREN
jgi:hypothetical protein